MKTSELIGPALDWAVAKCEFKHGLTSCEDYSPSADWSQGGPIIDREAITLSAYCSKDDSVDWYAGRFSMKSTTPLIAAMRCYVYSELGDEVDIPKELL